MKVLRTQKVLAGKTELRRGKGALVRSSHLRPEQQVGCDRNPRQVVPCQPVILPFVVVGHRHTLAVRPIMTRRG